MKEVSTRLDIPAVLTRVPFLQDLPAERIAQLGAATRLRTLKKGERLFERGDLAAGLFIVAYGQIKEAVRSAQGDEKIIEIVGPNRSFGETAMLLDCPYPYFAEALVDTLVLGVSRESMLDILTTHAVSAACLLGTLSMRLHTLVGDIEAYTLRRPEQRLIGYLMRCHDHGGGSAQAMAVSLPAPKHAIASRLGMKSETFSRILKAYSDAGLISVDGRKILIADPDRLRAMQMA